MSIWRKAALLAVLITAVAAGGCGGSEDSGSAPDSPQSDLKSTSNDSGPLTKPEFVKQANAACTNAREGGFERIAAYVESHRSDGLPPAVLEAKALKLTLLSIIAAETAAIRQLEAPPGDEKEVEAMLAGINADFGEAKKVRLEAGLNPEAIEDQFLDVNKQIRAYGLVGCVK